VNEEFRMKNEEKRRRVWRNMEFFILHSSFFI